MHDDETRSRDEQQTEDLTRTRQVGTPASSQPAPLPDSIGKYKILSKLGEGGMGVVYEAQQESPRRKVAVKVVRGGQFVDDQRIKMFQREADTLALLKHPNIGGIHESGRTEDGQHFFAMELVQGQTLDVYMKTRPKILDAAEFRFRLALLRKIASAVRYAHQRGVIHRDLKPSNIVVTEDSVDDESRTLSGIRLPEIKILDFGLARITEGDMAATTMVTEVGTIKGTLPYMSPEQARGNPEEIDVRTDVYSLGVILYEMLSGQRPYDVLRKSVAEAVRVICEEPPASLTATISGMRRLDPDVETIVGKALEKELDRRYDSAAALSDDIDRYLTSQPLLARPPSTMYQLTKFAKRNRVLVGGVVATFIVLVAGIVVSTTLGFREAAQRREANRQRDEAIRQKYVANLIAAESSLRLNEVKLAKRQLAECPEELRGWEWSYLSKRLDESVASFKANDDMVLSIAFSPDGSRIVAAGRQRMIRLLDAETGEVRKILEGHEGWVRDVAFNPDGTRIASAGQSDKTVRVWDAQTGDMLESLTGHEEAVLSVAFSPDGSRIASGSWGYTIRVWDAATGAPLMTLNDQSGRNFGLTFSPDGEILASSGGGLHLWDARSGELLRTLTGHGRQVNGVAFGSDSTRLASADMDGAIRLWDVATGEELAVFEGDSGGLWAVAFSPDGTRIASGSEDRKVRVWDVASGELLAVWAGHEELVASVAFAPDGIHLASGSGDGTVKLWDLPSLAETASGEMVSILEGHEEGIFSVVFSPDGTLIASTAEDGGIRLWDTATGELRGAPTGYEDRGGALALFDGDDLRVATGSGDGTFRLWDPTSGEFVATMTGHQAPVITAAFSPDGERFVSGSMDTDVRLWDATTGELLATMNGHSEQVNTVTFSPDGTRIASCSGDNTQALDKTIRIWDASSGELLRTLEGHTSDVWSVAFSPDGSRLASASQDRTVRLWDATSGELLQTLQGHDAWVQDVAFSPDGTRIAAGSTDGTVRLWDASSGDLLLALRGHEGGVNAVAFSPDGTRIVSGDSSGVVRLW